MRILWQPFYTLFVLATFVASLVIAFPFFLVIGLSDTVKARRAIWLIVKYWSKGWFWLIGMPLRRSGYTRLQENYVIVANHISYLDTVAIYAAVPTYFRALAKIEMAKIPVFGFVYKQLAILVDRSSAHSRARSMRLMWRLLKNESNILIFPEGTFNETGKPLKEFYDGAFRLALTTKTPMLPVLFPDTVHRWHYSGWWKLSPGRNRAIFLDPVPVDGLEMKDVPLLKQRVFEAMEAGLIKAG